MAFSPDSRLLALSGSEVTISVGELSSGRELYSLPDHREWVVDLDISPDSRSLASASADGTARIWDLATGRQLRRLTGPQLSYFSRAALAPDGQGIFCGGFDGGIGGW